MHKVDKNGNVLVDWKTGDPEGDRANLFKAYRCFLKELKDYCKEPMANGAGSLFIINRWKIAELDVDDFPRISVEYPKDFKE